MALVVMRATPEYILAFILLQVWRPSMLPAVVALALHDGAIVGHLGGRQTETMMHRPDAPPGRVLGIRALGVFVDSAFADLRLDRALILTTTPAAA